MGGGRRNRCRPEESAADQGVGSGIPGPAPRPMDSPGPRWRCRARPSGQTWLALGPAPQIEGRIHGTSADPHLEVEVWTCHPPGGPAEGDDLSA